MAAPANKARILVVDDERSICDVLRVALSKDGYEVDALTDPAEALERFRKSPHDIVLSDIRMPGMDGLELLSRLREASPSVVVIVMTAYSAWETAVEAMRRGAFDYLRKPFDTHLDIRGTIVRALAARSAAGGEAALDEAMSRVGLMIGDSRQMKQVRDIIRRAAPTDSSVLIEGESGVGKELAARALHQLSHRAARPFLAVNCGAFPENLLESELFGHTKGSFTGAVVDKTGLLEVAEGGTFFLDEISEMSPSLQVKLLRVLEEKEFKPVGGVRTTRVDVRFFAATNRDLDAEIKAGRFRQDLYYRLKVIVIHLPPLRERKEDIAPLAGFFLRKYCRKNGKAIEGFTEDAKDALLRHSWPGNVRELENAIERAVALCDGSKMQPRDLFEGASMRSETAVRGVESRLTREGMDLEREMEDIEAAFLKRALDLSEGNYTKAAQMLRMSLRSFRYRLSKHRESLGVPDEPA